MWNKRLVECAKVYPSGVLSAVGASGEPASVRCVAEFDEERELIGFQALPPFTAGWSGKSCLLFHRHDADLGGQHEMMIKGELSEEGGEVVLRPHDFVTGSGKLDTDVMPVAGSALDMIRFMRLGQRKSREYLAKRGEAWPPRPFKKMIRYLDEHKDTV